MLVFLVSPPMASFSISQHILIQMSLLHLFWGKAELSRNTIHRMGQSIYHLKTTNEYFEVLESRDPDGLFDVFLADQEPGI